jgi:hypothetical protein
MKQKKIRTVITVTDTHEVASVTIHRNNQDKVTLHRNDEGQTAVYKESQQRQSSPLPEIPPMPVEQPQVSEPHPEPLPRRAHRARIQGHGKKSSIDELKEIAREILMDEDLEVSKVRPFFWSMVEAYLDRFHQYPFDMVKAMICYLELRECPERQLEELMGQINDLYKKQYGKAMSETEKPMPQTGDTIYDEIRELRETLKHAAIVGERMEAE